MKYFRYFATKTLTKIVDRKTYAYLNSKVSNIEKHFSSIKGLFVYIICTRVMSEMYANKWDISSEGKTPQMLKWYLVTYELNVYVILVLCKVFQKTFSRWQIVIFLNASTTFAYSKSFCNAIYFQVSFFCSKQHSWLLLFHPFLCVHLPHTTFVK